MPKKRNSYRAYVLKKLAALKPIFAKAAVGDYSLNLRIPEEEDEFLELTMGIQVMLEVIRNQLSEVRGANKNLKRLVQLKTDFTSMVSHELRTPLNAIREAISLVLDEVDGPVSPAQHATLSIAKNNVDRMARLIENILNFTRLELGRYPISPVSLDLKPFLKEIYEFQKPAVQKKRISFHLQLPEAEVSIEGDGDALKSVLFNLLDNALKYTERGGRISLQLTERHPHVQIEVRDTGAGIRKADQKNIFQLYGRGTNHQILKKSGAGIGLAVCKMILDRHQATLSVKSAPGQGTTFTIHFPKRVRRGSR